MKPSTLILKKGFGFVWNPETDYWVTNKPNTVLVPIDQEASSEFDWKSEPGLEFEWKSEPVFFLKEMKNMCNVHDRGPDYNRLINH